MRFWGLALLFLAFASKVSLAFFGIPSTVSVIIFQHGIHPYANIVLNFLLGFPLLLYILANWRKLDGILRAYRTMIFLLLVMFFGETLLQWFFVEGGKGIFAWFALASTYWLILMFGLLIPLVVKPGEAVKFISTWALNFVVLSLIVWVVRPDVSFKGGRFIGLFKHIPFMVTCAMLGIGFTLGRFPQDKSSLKRAWFVVGITLSFVALLLTGTRSALAAAVMSVILWVLRAPSESVPFRYFKYSTGLVLTAVVILFGAPIAEYASDIATGKKAMADREAQDGVASRMEEVERGWEYFQTSPYLGRGLLSKFSGKDDLDVSSYNSFKDPHNIFASAGVVGGWPFIIWTGFFVLLITGLSIRALMSEDPMMHVFAIYAITQIPILIIYHWHLSLGGLADRMYWLVFGYLALQIPARPSPTSVTTELKTDDF
jgi:hypothetical protein